MDVTAATAATTAPETTSLLGGLGSDGFLDLLIAQLRYQSPMSPSDPSSMLQQTGQMVQVETLQQMAATQQQLLGMNETALASGLLGREVTASIDGEEVAGIVEAVRFTTLGPVLVVGEHEIPVGAATELRV